VQNEPLPRFRALRPLNTLHHIPVTRCTMEIFDRMLANGLRPEKEVDGLESNTMALTE
jgi:hypothetical protein